MRSKYLEGMFEELPVRRDGNILYSNIKSSKIFKVGKLEFRNIEKCGKTFLESQFLDYMFTIEKHSESQFKGQDKVCSYTIDVEYKEHYKSRYIMSGVTLDVSTCPLEYMKNVFSSLMERVSCMHIKNIVED